MKIDGPGSEGQHDKAHSVPVVFASDSDPLPLSPGAAADATLTAMQSALQTSLDQLRTDLQATLTIVGVIGGTVAVSNFPAAQPVTDNGGSLTVDSPQLPDLVNGRLPVDGSGVTQPVSGTITEASAAAILTKLSADPATQTTLAAILTKLIAAPATSAKQPALGTAGTASADVVSVQGVAGGVAQPVSAASLPLPAGAATETSLGTDGSSPASIPGTGVRGWLRSIYDKLAGTLTVSGTFYQAMQPVSLAALPALAAGSALIGKVEQQTYTAPFSGEIAGSTSAAQLPNLACKLAKIKAQSTNAGSVYIGVSGVTKPDGTTDTTTGLELQAGDETGWIPVDNLNRLYYISTNSVDKLTYFGVV